MAILLHKADLPNIGRPKVNLTLIGGGAFQVPMEIVLKSLKDAIDVYKSVDVDIAVHAFRADEAQAVTSSTSSTKSGTSCASCSR